MFDYYSAVSDYLQATQGREIDYWSDFEPLPKSDWKHEVANNDTLLGYWQWVYLQLNHDGELEKR